MISLLQIVCTILMLFCFGYFTFAASYAGIRSTFLKFWPGLGLCLLFAIVGMEIHKRKGILSRIPFSLRIIMISVFGVVILVYGIMILLVVSGMDNHTEEEQDYLIVLGAQVRGTKVTKSLAKRLNATVEYAVNHPDTKIICSGGQGIGEDVTEASAMKQYLVERGVDESLIILEEQSTNTYENLKFSMEIIGSKDKKVAIVTNNFHVYRACYLAGKLGFKHVSGIAADSDKRLLINYIAREGFALAKEFVIHFGKNEEIDLGRLEESKEVEPMKITLEEGFYYEPLSDEVINKISGLSYKENNSIDFSDLRFVTVQYIGFDKMSHEGNLIVNVQVADDVVSIFAELYHAQYEIEKIRLVDEYGADDDASMADNNTSAFNFRVIDGTDVISDHGYGIAIDINPLYNPYVRTGYGSRDVLPVNGTDYADRTKEFEHKITETDICYQTFAKRGWQWGGSWDTTKDYQHFYKPLND